MDALSEALTSVHMTGAIFYHAECAAPWGFRVPPLEKIAHVLAPGTERLVGYHLVVEGNALVEFPTATLSLTAGDVLLIPPGEGHTVSNGSPSEFLDSGASLGRFLTGELRTMRVGGGGEVTRIVCGYFGCERSADKLFLAGLPLIKVNLRGDARGEWLENSVRHLVSQAESRRPGQAILLAKMADALFIETLRRHMEQLPPEQTGWLAGARDPIVGAALAALHRKPSHRWTLEELAAEGATSRSVLAERFTRFLGEPPLTYLARWRLQLAARLLRTTLKAVLQVAAEVGYDSEAAFNRAFKREFGSPPAQYRKKLARADGHSRPSKPSRAAARRGEVASARS